jgi:hypothetical protein
MGRLADSALVCAGLVLRVVGGRGAILPVELRVFRRDTHCRVGHGKALALHQGGLSLREVLSGVPLVLFSGDTCGLEESARFALSRDSLHRPNIGGPHHRPAAPP